jgi:hypothetical protein
METDINYFYEHLKHELRKKSQIPMWSYSECNLLAAKLFTSGFSVSPHTIARLFGFLPMRRFYPSTLNIFCRYLGFDDFSQFKSIAQQRDERNILSERGIFENPNLSTYSFQLSLELADEKSLKNHLDALNVTHDDIEDLAHLTGFLVRKSNQQSLLLQWLIEARKGRVLFYERFVDEDDPEGYYSNALKIHYLNVVDTKNNQLFYYTYIISNAIYKSKIVEDSWIHEFNKLDHDIDFNSLHFHEISRLFEVRVLLLKAKGYNTTEQQLFNQLLPIAEKMDPHAQSWILARFLKALSFNSKQDSVLDSEELRMILERLISKVKIESIGEAIVQLFYHFLIYKKFNSSLNPPLKINSLYTDNEFTTRLSIESAQRFLYVSKAEKQLLYSHLNSYCKRTNNTWVLKLLRKLKTEM